MPESGFTQVMKFRQGATFKKVDLHNHTPASQCSSYRLPPELHAIFDIQGRRFFDDFTRIQKKLKEVSVLKARDVAVLKAEREKLKRRLLVEDQAFAGSTRNVPRRLRSPKTRDHARKCDAEKEAFRRKSERYVKSFYFPLEYVLRCLIEGMEVTALTDHNHPGYIMPERPELGTWYDRIVQENTRLLKSRAKGARGERKVRKLITDRLTTALAHLSDRKPSLVKGEPPDSKHRDKGRKTRKKRERMEHITECLNYFQQGGSIRRLDILQGAEITVSDIHILAIFPHQFYTPITIASLLKNVGIHEDQWGDGFVAAGEMSPQEVIDRIDESGGIAIPAHSNSSFKGLFMLFKKGLALSKVLQHKSLYAAEYIEGKINPLLGTRAQFESRMSKSRTYRKHGLTFVRGSDAHECRIECDGTGEDIGWRRYSYIKMDIRPNDTSNDVFNSLKIALKNGFNRVVEMPPDDIYYPFGMVRKMKKKKIPLLGKEERASVLRTQERLTITGVLVKGGYADGVSLRFNPYLNCIVGKTGKSTILRLAGYP
ncbi:MAG: PHP domain-containing protein, partial [bacterium]